MLPAIDWSKSLSIRRVFGPLLGEQEIARRLYDVLSRVRALELTRQPAERRFLMTRLAQLSPGAPA
jgi:predicted RNA polymerase sigma factor